MRRILPAMLFVLASACSLGQSGQVEAFPRGTKSVQGTLLFESRVATPYGVSRSTKEKPVRLSKVSCMDAGGALVDESYTSIEGVFQLECPNRGGKLVVESRIDPKRFDLAVTTDSLGRKPHEYSFTLTDERDDGVYIIRDDETHRAPAFHLLDMILRGSRKVRAWTGHRLPTFYVYWLHGKTTEWSYYRGERPKASGRYMAEIMSGNPVQPDADSDEHDENIVLHEFGHFVMDQLTTDSSHGGGHPSGHLIDPGLAWEEGRVSWFSSTVLGSPEYVDTVGRAPYGRLRVRENFEWRGAGPRGVGSEAGVAEVLWDLCDGVDGIVDQDNDGVALGPAAILQAMIDLRVAPGSFPNISTFLQQLLREHQVSVETASAMLTTGGHPLAMLKSGKWPSDIGIPGYASGKIDGVSNPAPSGGPARASNGIDAVHIYRFEVKKSGWLTAKLNILGSGRAVEQSDLDLELRSIRADLIDSARDQEKVETLKRRLKPGWYVLYVRDGGNGNRTGYELDVGFREAAEVPQVVKTEQLIAK